MRQMNEVNRQRLEELNQIKGENGGMVQAATVVKFASDKATALYSWKGWSGWDKNKAAEAHWLTQARTLIRAMITVESIQGKDTKIHAFVSIIEDRKMKGGGYRLMLEVLRNEDLRAKMLNTALMELQAFQGRYKDFSELASVFDAINETAADLKPAKGEPKPEQPQPTA